ncbi:MAG: nuclear transport factor 2 family protein [Bacteroidetes bacterium]|nr:nuclear transport factor 2 family protein [Bacteroidota bacterium]
MKKLFFPVLCAVFTACNTPTPESQNEILVRQMFEAFNRHDWKAMIDFYADTAEFLDPGYGTEYVRKARSETATKYTEMQNMFPDLHDEVVTLFSNGDKVVVEFISSGSASGKKFKLPISTVLTIVNGKIVRDATYYNNCNDW